MSEDPRDQQQQPDERPAFPYTFDATTDAIILADDAPRDESGLEVTK